MPYIAGTRGAMWITGVPTAGVDEIQSMVIGGAPAGGGTYVLNVGGFPTGSIAWSNVNATLLAALQAALDTIPGVGANGIVATAGSTPALTAGVGQVLLTFSGTNMSKRAQPTITVVTNSLGGTGTLAITEQTAGVDMNPPYPVKGAVAINQTTGKMYSNEGTPTAPTWVVTGTQT